MFFQWILNANQIVLSPTVEQTKKEEYYPHCPSRKKERKKERQADRQTDRQTDRH